MRSEAISRSESPITMPSAGHDLPAYFEQADCEIHGHYESRVTTIFKKRFQTTCPKCSVERRAQEEAAELAEKARDARIAMENKLGSAMIPKRFADRSFADYKAENEGQREALRICRKYAEVFQEIYKSGRCLLLLGKPGTGKTHLAAAIANQIMAETAATAVYRTVGSILHAIRATYDKGAEQSEAKILSALVSPSLLILDEIGVTKEKPSDFELTTLFAIINGRYEQQRPTVVVSNLKAEELPAAIGERSFDRLREGGGIAVKFDWESQRGKETF